MPVGLQLFGKMSSDFSGANDPGDLLEIGPPPSNAKVTTRVLPKSDVIKVAEVLQTLKPNLAVEAPYEMENVREVLLFIAPLYQEFKAPAKCIAQVAGILTMLRHHFEFGAQIDDVFWGSYYRYNAQAPQAVMQEKLLGLRGMDRKMVVEMKLEELTAAAAWMKQISEETEGWHLCAFTGAYVCIADVAVHVGHQLRTMATDA